ncbi:TrmB family transcriptional regulator [Halocalculus aciditolerans]|uniref:Transcriptional regulator n=1 Tax=Halocalculus aciditolerans TaxID=1383812 RepID=A0A830FIE9_9EURY|nr:TrmB family transcriptional regulator [Halocalculus aciditolerans]GGL50365.1 transcriptional regulator [Halocalculus aciditolerans]
MATLRDLGLSEYEANAYRSLLETGPTTAKELSAASDVPMGRIYDVLSSLESQHLVRAQSAGRPKSYAAVDPESALDDLLAARKRELAEQAEQYEDIVDDLTGELSGVDTPDAGFWEAAVGPDDAVSLLLERIATADDHVLMAAATPVNGIDLSDVSNRLLTALVDAVDRGVTVDLLANTDLYAELPTDINEQYVTELLARDGYDARATDAVDGDLTVIDDAEVCLSMPNPVDHEETFALVAVTDPEFAAEVTDELRETWQDATPLTAAEPERANAEPDDAHTEFGDANPEP